MTDMRRGDFRFFHRLRVRWAEVDVQQVVFNAHYLTYIDTAITDYWRALALPYEATLKSLNGELFVKKATLEYQAAAHMEDQLDVALKCSRIGNSSFNFTSGLFRGNQLLLIAELVYVFADAKTLSACPVPAVLRQAMLDYEAGKSLVQLELGTWQALGEQARVLRHDVFMQEQGVPAAMDYDAADDSALHVLVRNRLGLTLATGRLLQPAPGVGQLSRIAVHRVLRGSRLGRDVVLALMQASRERGDRELCLFAQSGVEGFYTRLGFVPRGQSFVEAGIGHIEMVYSF
jgi:YbgC/YbaW family acyl-CoA thioester hydrolase